MTDPVCPFCKQPAKLVRGDVLYAGRSDLRYKKFWQCLPCDAQVGCHLETAIPLGPLANEETRSARWAAHSSFDLLWKTGILTRGAAYAALKQRTGIAHIGESSVAECKRVVQFAMAFFKSSDLT